MKCKQCDDDMEDLSVFDSPKTGFAYNLKQCDNCGMIAKVNVWNEPGILWIPTELKGISFQAKGIIREAIIKGVFRK